MKLDQDLRLNLWYDFGKMNSTLGSVVPLAMFSSREEQVILTIVFFISSDSSFVTWGQSYWRGEHLSSHLTCLIMIQSKKYDWTLIHNFFHLTESLSLGADNLSVPIPYHLLVLLQNGDDVNKNSFAILMHMLIRAVDRILKSRIKSDLKSRIKSDLSDFLTGRKPLLLWSF